MSGHTDPHGRNSFIAVAVIILGGLLFGAGVMVGKQLQLDDPEDLNDSLARIDKRDKGVLPTEKGEELEFHEALSRKEKTEVLPAPEPKKKPAKESNKVGDAARVGAKVAARAVAPKKEEKQEQKKPQGGKKYIVQVASYKELSQAEQLRDKLSAKNYPEINISAKVVDGKGTYYRVRLGPFEQREQAVKYEKKLKKGEGLETLVMAVE